MQTIINALDSWDLRALRLSLRWTPQDAADYVRRSLRTWQRWETNPPAAIVYLLRYRAGLREGWDGWRILPGEIWTPAGECITRQQLDMYHWTLRALRHEAGWERLPPVPGKVY